MKFALLGPLEITDNGRAVPIPPARQRVLLGCLLLRAGELVTVDELVEAIWGDALPARPRRAVQTYVTRLRKLLGAELIQGRLDGYVMAVAAGDVDVGRFELLLEQARDAAGVGDRQAEAAVLRQALGLWRGEPLADVPSEVLRRRVVERLGEQRLEALERRIEADLALGRHAQLVSELRVLTHTHPLREGLWAQLMTALYRCGRRADALQAFTRARDRLVEELGIDPGPQLQRLQRAILTSDATLAVSSAPARPVAVVKPAQLPADVAGFVGRARHLEQLDALLAAAAPSPAGVVITTIAGMAGVGKTALAVHWAHRAASRFSDGQLYIDLRGFAHSPPMDPLQALAGLLRALGVRAEQVPVELEEAAGLYRSLLAGKRMLVLLDNAHDATQVRPLLPGHPGCMALITSRNQLTGLVASHGARRLALDVLDPAEALALLGEVLGADRVAAEPGASVALARACGYLPLALRIAAANLTARPDRPIAGYLAELQAGDRLDGLMVDGDAQAAVQVAFACSYRDLPAESRRLFRLLGLTPGPEVSVAGAAALAGITPPAAARLLDRLVAAHLVEPRGTDRFGAHDLLRLYARQQTGQEDPEAERAAALRRLLDWYLDSVDTAAKVLYPDKLRLPPPPNGQGPAIAAAFDAPAGAMAWLEAERANLVAAVQSAAAQGPLEAAWLLADALRGYFWLQRHTTQWLLAAHAGLTAAECAGDTHAQAVSHLSLGDAHQAIGRYQQAIQHYATASTLAGQVGWTLVQAICLTELGVVHWWSGDLEQAADHHAQALEAYRRTGRRNGMAGALINHSLVSRDLGQLHQAARQQRRALDLGRQLGSRQIVANALGNLGVTFRELGRLGLARRCLTRALDLYREVEDRFGQTWVLCALAPVFRDTGCGHQALDTARAAVGLADEIGHRSAQAAALANLAGMRRCLGHHQQAIRSGQEALDLARRTQTRGVEAEALYGLAADCLALGRHDQARVHAERALGLYRQTGHRLGKARTLRLLGTVLNASGHDQAAVDCWQQAQELFAGTGSPEADTVRRLLHA